MLLDEFWFAFWEYWHCEKFVLGLYEYVHDACEKNLLACVSFVLWTWQNFVGKFMGMENFDYGKISTMKNFVGYVMLVQGKFLWL